MLIVKDRYELYLENDPDVQRLKNNLLPAFPELNNLKIMKGDSSYILNKSKIYLCTEYNGTKYDDNMMTFVILHELAHALTHEIGHGDEFQNNFSRLLERAKIYNLFDPNKPRVEKYCTS